MALKHGVFPKEIPTAILPPSELADGVPVFIGTAPVQQVDGGLENVNKPIYCSNKKDAVSQLGYSTDWKKYTLCEAMYAAFDVYGIAPVIFINVLDPEEHTETIAGDLVTLISGKVTLPNGVLLDTLTVKSEDGQEEYNKNTDYLLSYTDEGALQLSVVPAGTIPGSAAKLAISCTVLDPTLVTKADIIGGIDINTGRREGLEAITEVFLRYNKIPGSIGAPGFADDSEVGAVMTAKGYGINGVFKAQQIALDINTETCRKYSDVPAAKKAANFVDPLQTVCWPMGKLGDKVYHGSTIAICRKALTDFNNDGVPYWSPSNQTVQIDASILADKTQILLDLTDANYLNENGVATFLNFIGGWKFWGNRTAAYPGITDPKDVFISLRSMMSWWGNREVLSFWQLVDNPMNKRLLTTIMNSMQIDINGLVAEGALVGGRINIRADENPVTELINGKVSFHVNLGFAVPAEEIEFNNEYDTSYIEQLISSLAS